MYVYIYIYIYTYIYYCRRPLARCTADGTRHTAEGNDTFIWGMRYNCSRYICSNVLNCSDITQCSKNM